MGESTSSFYESSGFYDSSAYSLQATSSYRCFNVWILILSFLSYLRNPYEFVQVGDEELTGVIDLHPLLIIILFCSLQRFLVGFLDVLLYVSPLSFHAEDGHV